MHVGEKSNLFLPLLITKVDTVVFFCRFKYNYFKIHYIIDYVYLAFTHPDRGLRLKGNTIVFW